MLRVFDRIFKPEVSKPEVSGLALVFLSLLAYQPSAVAQPIQPGIGFDDAICYMQIGNRVIDLSQICGKTISLSETDQSFLQNYQTLLSRRTRKMPSTQTVLSLAQNDPKAIIQRAQAACAAMREGASNLAFATADRPDADVVNKLALNYYCPELDD
ncbi:MAG: DUF732 domain-containing protein [Leptolyngbyaceae cyanobacterium bins.59]|nr:DUF732 domain-containing protein [Leptolyngbyaceae cyanobacterium bins.59]